MIPVLIGAVAVAAGVYALSDDDKPKKTKTRRYINGDWVIEETVTKVEIDEIPSAIPKNDVARKFCPYCGAKVLSSDAKFCSGCGKSLADN